MFACLCVLILIHVLRNQIENPANFSPCLSCPFTAHCPNDQAWRPLEVGVCDGNHGPRQPLCLQHPQHRRGPDQRPRGANPGRAGHHRNSPQPFSGHFRLHLHVCHLSSPTVGEGGGATLVPSAKFLHLPFEVFMDKKVSQPMSSPKIRAIAGIVASLISTCTSA